ncbi:protein of unknown function [Nitrospira defluvii]|uniref:Uncharacterized protein n=1 Tax=Nitrospira defluvii TaxID=330214 RepID=D8PEQ9_9BACT|nr:protein of unknown function [Nitrospira defluvii]
MIRQQSHRQARRRLPEQLEEGFVVVRFVKHRRVGIAVRDHVIAKAPNRRACGAWHGPT